MLPAPHQTRIRKEALYAYSQVKGAKALLVEDSVRPIIIVLYITYKFPSYKIIQIPTKGKQKLNPVYQ